MLFNLLILLNALAGFSFFCMAVWLAMGVDDGYEIIAWLILGPPSAYCLICALLFYLYKRKSMHPPLIHIVFATLTIVCGILFGAFHQFLMVCVLINTLIYILVCIKSRSSRGN